MKWSISRISWGPFFVLSLVILFHLFLISKTFLIDKQGNMRAAAAGYGDIPFHMTEVSKFAFEKKIDFNEPIFTGERMRYSFLINLISGFILQSTGRWYFALQFPAMTFMSLATIITFLIYRKFLKSGWAAVLAVIIFLFGSGFGANWHFQNYLGTYANHSFEGFINYLVNTTASTITRYDAVFPNQNIGWGAPLSLVLLHQRSFFFGILDFALFMLVLESWLRNPKNNIKTIILGLIVGIGPLGHFHTFIAMGLILAVTGILAIVRKNAELVRRLAILGTLIFLIAGPQIIYLLQGNTSAISGGSFLKFRLGWMVEPTIGSIKFDARSGFLGGSILPFFNFLILNFGVVLPIFIIGGFLIVFGHRSFKLQFKGIGWWWLCGATLFLAVQLVRFQPWDYDNNKILVYFQFFAAPIFVAFFVWLLKYSKILGAILFFAFFTLGTFSGFIDQIPRFLVPNEKLPIIFNTDAIEMADFIKNDLPYGQNIITSSSHLNPVSSLAGRPVLVGYPGWLWTRGIEYGKREQDLKMFYSDPVVWKFIADSYSGKFVVVDPTAIFDWHANVSAFERNYRLVFQNNSFRIFKLN